MGDVLNLNRFRKKKAREEQRRHAETNRRLHGRSAAERAQQQAEKAWLETKLDGAFLLRDSVTMDDIPTGEDPGDFELLEEFVRSTELHSESRPEARDEIADRPEVKGPRRDDLQDE